MRCANCRGLNRDDAKWCSQCLMRFDKPAGGVLGAEATVIPALPLVPTPQSPAESPPLSYSEVDPAADRTIGAVASSAHEGGAGVAATWRCTVCLNENPLTADICSSCGTGFFDVLRSTTSKRLGVKGNPAVAAALSIIPGAGHVYLRRIGEAAARLMIAVWWAGTALAVSGRRPATLMVRVLFWLALVALAAISAFDAYRQADDPDATSTLSSRLLLYWSLGMLVILVFGLTVVTFSAQR